MSGNNRGHLSFLGTCWNNGCSCCTMQDCPTIVLSCYKPGIDMKKKMYELSKVLQFGIKAQRLLKSLVFNFHELAPQNVLFYTKISCVVLQ